MAESEALAVVTTLIAGWEAMDGEAIGACFAEDGVWHNMPYPPIRGRAAIAASVSRFLGQAEEVRFVVHHQAEIAPGIVVTERNDIFTMRSGETVDLPVMGIFEIAAGHIVAWRDYFDAAAMPG